MLGCTGNGMSGHMYPDCVSIAGAHGASMYRRVGGPGPTRVLVLARDGNGNSRGILGSQNPARYVRRYGIHGIPAGRAARDGMVFRTGFRAGIIQTRGFKCL